MWIILINIILGHGGEKVKKSLQRYKEHKEKKRCLFSKRIQRRAAEEV